MQCIRCAPNATAVARYHPSIKRSLELQRALAYLSATSFPSLQENVGSHMWNASQSQLSSFALQFLQASGYAQSSSSIMFINFWKNMATMRRSRLSLKLAQSMGWSG